MNQVARFIDTGYWLAVVNTRDVFYARATELARVLRGPFVTTELVVIELGDSLTRLQWRSVAIPLLQTIRGDPHIEIVPFTTALLERAIALYTARSDKEWGLTDCVSFLVMQDRGVTEALSADQHFIQAGFRALLREEP